MGASLFKHLFGGVLVNKEGEKSSKYSILVRNFLFFIILCLVVFLRFLLNTSYIFIVVIFFILFDFMVFTRKRNLLDVITGSYLVSQKKVDRTISEKDALLENVKRYIDEEGETLVQKYQIRSVPTTLLLDENNEVIYKVMGNVPEKDFIMFINKALEKENEEK